MKKVVIIGGGFAGSTAARKLEKDFAVTLIDTKEYFEFTPSILRTLVEPSHVKKVQVLHTHYLHHAHFERGTVTAIKEKEVELGEKTIPFDYLIIASGSSYKAPIKEQNVVSNLRADHLRAFASRVKTASNIAVVGGGLVGVELVGEIVDKYPEKNVTLIHSKKQLIERNPEKAGRYAKKVLAKKGVNIILNEKVVGADEKTCTLTSGEKICADLVFLCTGIEKNTGFMDAGKEGIHVNDFLQVEGKENIFSAGDVNNIQEEKTAQNAEKQAELIAENIRCLETGKPLHRYVKITRPLVISLGKKKGIFVKGNMVFTGIIPALIKHAVEWKEMRKLQ